jgi:hypothetical protein
MRQCREWRGVDGAGWRVGIVDLNLSIILPSNLQVLRAVADVREVLQDGLIKSQDCPTVHLFIRPLQTTPICRFWVPTPSGSSDTIASSGTVSRAIARISISSLVKVTQLASGCKVLPTHPCAHSDEC